MIPRLEDCNPGFEPTEYNIVIAAEDAERVTKGGIILTDKIADQQGLASMRGRLVAVSPLAFNFDNWPDHARKPEVGDEIIFAKYAGTLQEGFDGREYRLCKDKDVIAVVRAPVVEVGRIDTTGWVERSGIQTLVPAE